MKKAALHATFNVTMFFLPDRIIKTFSERCTGLKVRPVNCSSIMEHTDSQADTFIHDTR